MGVIIIFISSFLVKVQGYGRLINKKLMTRIVGAHPPTFKTPGMFKTSFLTSNFPPGCFFWLLKTCNYKQKKKKPTELCFKSG